MITQKTFLMEYNMFLCFFCISSFCFAEACSIHLLVGAVQYSTLFILTRD